MSIRNFSLKEVERKTDKFREGLKEQSELKRKSLVTLRGDLEKEVTNFERSFEKLRVLEKQCLKERHWRMY